MSDVLNQELLQELRMVMEDEFPALMETFLQESARQFEQAQQAWKIKDMESLWRSAHTLKGSCGNIGAESLQSTCTQLESFAKKGSELEIAALLDTAGQQLEEVNGAIQSL